MYEVLLSLEIGRKTLIVRILEYCWCQ